jgi:predicted short-subunit dehydrogenase-like oxidoreductase (DUF2520 family)
MNANELADELEDALDTDSWCQECALETTKPIARQAATMLRQQQAEIDKVNAEYVQAAMALGKCVQENHDLKAETEALKSLLPKEMQDYAQLKLRKAQE